MVILFVGVATTTLTGMVVHVRASKNSPVTENSATNSSSSDDTITVQKSEEPEVAAKNNEVKPEIKPTALPSKGTVLWQENFATYKSSTPNASYWNIAGASQPIYNEEVQKYDTSTQNVRVESGNLILEARKTPTGYTSGMVDTKGKVRITQGTRLEARIRLPKGRGVWPAFWLMSDNQPHTSVLNPTDADWESERFYMHDGEVDIMESYGTYPGVVESTLHTFSKSTENQYSPIDDNFHTYWMEWSGSKLVMGVDDKTISTVASSSDTKLWPLTNNNQMYVILNLAMGGNGGGQIIPSVSDNWQMQIASITQLKLP